MKEVNRIQIEIIRDLEDTGRSTKKLLSIERKVSVDGRLVYKDKISPKTYITLKDSIRDFEEYLLGLTKECQSTKDVTANCRD